MEATTLYRVWVPELPGDIGESNREKHRPMNGQGVHIAAYNRMVTQGPV